MSQVQRPLSPHLQIWRWQMNMALSILHRASGIASALGALLLVWWVSAIALGPDYYEFFRSVMGSFIGRLVLFGVTLAVMAHLMTGIRHLLMDTGRLLEKDSAARIGPWLLLGALVLTLVVWAGAYHFAGLL
ncbi:MAG: succinate dehydrogenase, cytochrome b556 subunit [Alphaproteobacteria bacterium]|nr:MAG: succinate dehydrogenase, cytochrome b556 subunit [Alphaproteobacteria bacterium]